MELTTLIVALAVPIILAATSLRFGVDSREGFPSKERELAARGLVWKTSPARDRFLANEMRQARLRQTPAAC
jgi:hypothetical protein